MSNGLARMLVRTVLVRSRTTDNDFFLTNKSAISRQLFRFAKVRSFCSSELVNANQAINPKSVNEIVKAIGDGIPSNKQFSQESIKKVVSYLLQEGAAPEGLVKRFSSLPQAANKDWTSWKSSVEIFRSLGANIDQIVRMISYNPAILDYSLSRIESLIDAMQATGIPSYDLVQRIAKNPEMLNLNSNEIKRRHEALKAMFTNKDISKMVSNNICVLAETSRDIEQRLQYIVHRMGIEQPQVVNSNVMTKPLQYIMERHEFLVRTGGYRKPNPKSKDISTNPKLRLIVDTSDHTFATKIAKVTLEEYHIFCRLAKERKNVLNKPLRPEDVEVDETDDDDDDDDDEFEE